MRVPDSLQLIICNLNSPGQRPSNLICYNILDHDFNVLVVQGGVWAAILIHRKCKVIGLYNVLLGVIANLDQCSQYNYQGAW